jgi:hypothetical protein
LFHSVAVLCPVLYHRAMTGLVPSPPFANPAANAIAEYHTGAVPAGGVTPATVAREARRKRKLADAFDPPLTAGGAPLVTATEYGMSVIREASAVAQAGGADVAPPWFAPALAAAMAAALAPLTIQGCFYLLCPPPPSIGLPTTMNARTSTNVIRISSTTTHNLGPFQRVDKLTHTDRCKKRPQITRSFLGSALVSFLFVGPLRR